MSLITVKAIGAKNLKNTETFSNQDPYMTLLMSPSDESILNFDRTLHKTKVHIDGGSMAIWGDSFEFSVPNHETMILTIEVWNKNLVKDHIIGRKRINMGEIFKNRPMDRSFEEWVNIEDQTNVSLAAGEVHLEFRWHNEKLRMKADADAALLLTQKAEAAERARVAKQKAFAEESVRQADLARALVQVQEESRIALEKAKQAEANRQSETAKLLAEIERMKLELENAKADAEKARQSALSAMASCEKVQSEFSAADAEKQRISKIEESARAAALSAVAEETNAQDNNTVSSASCSVSDPYAEDEDTEESPSAVPVPAGTVTDALAPPVPPQQQQQPQSKPKKKKQADIGSVFKQIGRAINKL